MYCITSCGGGFGLLLCPPIVGWLCKQSLAGGWPLACYTVGAAGSIWSIAWMILISDSPSTHPRISDKEIEYIISGIPDRGLNPEVGCHDIKAVSLVNPIKNISESTRNALEVHVNFHPSLGIHI